MAKNVTDDLRAGLKTLGRILEEVNHRRTSRKEEDETVNCAVKAESAEREAPLGVISEAILRQTGPSRERTIMSRAT